MSAPELGNVRLCSCCNTVVSRQTAQRHQKRSSLPVQPESPPLPKRRRTANFQAGQESFIIPLDKQKQSRTDNIPSTSRSRIDAGDHPLQPPGDAPAEASGLFVDDVLLNLYARTHRTTDQCDDESSEGALEEDAVEAAGYVDHEPDDFWNGEDLAAEGDGDPREGIVSDWDLLTEKFIVEAEELGKFGHSLLHTSSLTGFIMLRPVFHLVP